MRDRSPDRKLYIGFINSHVHSETVRVPERLFNVVKDIVIQKYVVLICARATLLVIGRSLRHLEKDTRPKLLDL